MHGNFSGEDFALHNFSQSRDKSSGENFSRAAPGGELRSPHPASPGDAAAGGMPGAFYNGTVKNQPRSTPEVLHIGSGEKFRTFAFLTICMEISAVRILHFKIFHNPVID
jgi:hypothetical protein